MIGLRTDHLFHYSAIFLFALLASLADSAKSTTQNTEAGERERSSSLQLSYLVIESGPIELKVLKNYLDLRLPSTKVMGNFEEKISEVQYSENKGVLTARVQIFQRSNELIFDLRLSDGRSFRRELESFGETGINTRAVASAMANLIVAIEAGKQIEHSSAITLDSGEIDVVPGQGEEVLDSSNPDSTNPNHRKGRNEHENQEMHRNSQDIPKQNARSGEGAARSGRVPKSIVIRRGGKNGGYGDQALPSTRLRPRRMIAELFVAPVVSLGIKDSTTLVRGLGLQLGAGLHLPSQFWIAAGVRNSFPLSRRSTGTIVLRTRVSTFFGYVFWGGKNFELPLGLGLTVEPWWIWNQKRRVELLAVETGRASRPLIGALLTTGPRIRVPMRLKRKSLLHIQLPLEVHLSGEARRGFGAPLIKREVQGAVLYHLGGLELNLAIQIRWGIPISGNSDSF